MKLSQLLGCSDAIVGCLQEQYPCPPEGVDGFAVSGHKELQEYFAHCCVARGQGCASRITVRFKLAPPQATPPTGLPSLTFSACLLPFPNQKSLAHWPNLVEAGEAYLLLPLVSVGQRCSLHWSSTHLCNTDIPYDMFVTTLGRHRQNNGPLGLTH